MDLEKNQNEEDWQPKLERFKDFRRTGRSSLLPLVFNCFFTFCYCPYYFIQHAQLNNVVYVLELLFLVLSLVCCWVVWGLFDATDEVLLRWRHRFKSTFTILVTLCFSFHFIVEFGSFGPEKVQEEGEFEFPTSLILLVIVPFKAAEVFRETNDVVLGIQLSIIILTLLLMMILSFTIDTLIIFVAYTVMIVLVRVDRAIFSWTVFDDVVEGKRKEEVKERANLELQKKFAEHTRNALEKRIIEMREMIGNVAHDLKTPLTSFATATEMIESDLQGFITTVNEMTTEYETLLVQLEQTKGNSGARFKLRINTLYSKMLSSMNSVRDIHAFMLMMINRSLDFTKASTGIALIPLVETVNLSAVMSKPLKCVRNIQQRVAIQVNSSLNLYTFIKTDRTWLEENLLCVLSNAIKYSSSNTVELSLSIVTLETLGKTAGRAEDEVMTEKELSSSTRANSNIPVQNNQRIDRRDKPIEVYNVNPNSAEEEKKSAHRVSSDVWLTTKTVRRASRGYALVYPKVGSSAFTTCNSSTSSIDCKGRIPSKSSLNGVNEEDTRQFVLFEVKDTGKRLSMQEMEMFFNPFEQQRLSGGTGLGLYSLAKRVEALGGQYGVHEREDGVAGNVVWFTIPYAVDYDSRSDEIKKEEINISNVLPFQRDVGSMRTANLLKEEESQKRILIVEDALAISKMTSSMLKRQKFETDIAENGQIAVDKVIRNYERWQSGLERRYDAILMDFQMPVMDGLEATMRIREYEKLHGIEDGCLIIGISAMSDAEKIEEALEIGMNAFIQKPFTCKDFHSYLQDFRQRK